MSFASMIALLLALLPTTAPVSPRIHAHNDYEHPRPLLDALDAGARSVEADIFLVNGKLLVAHSILDVRADRTLAALYLDPLRKRITGHGGSVYGDGETLVLLIDLKGDGAIIYPALRAALESYKDVLTHYEKQKTTGPITVILTGNQPLRSILTAEDERLVACDGSLKDLETNPSPDLVPWISGNWEKIFTWNGIGRMSDEERARLRDIVRRAHEQGRAVRFWGGPDNEAMWSEMQSAGVDWVNTDRLAEVRAFLDAHRYSQNSSTLPSGSRK